MKYEWDEKKSARNAKERGLPFEMAEWIDLDAALVEEDTRRDYAERRFVAYGMIEQRLHILCFTPIKGGIRVISFRKANMREVRHYEQALNR